MSSHEQHVAASRHSKKCSMEDWYVSGDVVCLYRFGPLAHVEDRASNRIARPFACSSAAGPSLVPGVLSQIVDSKGL